MVAWEPIQETITYIENNLACDLNVEILAHRVYLSPYYFQRLFNRLVNKNIAEYIKLRRLAKAAKLLKESDLSILAIAIECGFQSHSHFTKVFKNVYTITPSEYRDSNIHLDFFVQPDLSLNYSFIEEGKPYIVDDMVIEINEYECEEDIQFILENYYTKEEILKEFDFLLKDIFGIEVYDSRDKKIIALKMKNYLDEKFRSNVTNQLLAANFGFVPSYLVSIFKICYGLTPMDYLVNKRIDEAKVLLEDGSLKIKDIARVVGYEDSLYFSKVFKKFTGVSPKEYKGDGV